MSWKHLSFVVVFMLILSSTATIGARLHFGAFESNIITHTFLPLIAGGAVAVLGAK